jgi:glycosyltransferase involved in cell wall biosynthesis
VVSEPGAARRRAVVLVGGPVAPYSRAIRLARAIAAEGLDVEIAAVAAPGLPDREVVPEARPGTVGEPEPTAGRAGAIEIRRYRPSGPWRLFGASDAATGAVGGSRDPARAPDHGGQRITRRAVRVVAAPLLDVRRWLLWPHAVRGWWATLARELAPADLYHACGALAVAPALAKRRQNGRAGGLRSRIVYDAIDDVAGSNEAMRMPAAIRRRIADRERSWARGADAVTTVNAELASRLAARYGRSDEILVVPNFPEPQPSGTTDSGATTDSPLRAASGVGRDRRIVLFQGRLGPGLGLESAAEAILAVPNTALVLMGFGRGMGASAARDRDPRFAGRHVTLPSVHPDELPDWTAGADVMLIPLPPDSPNQRDATPNKFWEALAVGVPVVVVRGLVVMEELVRTHDLGAIAASPAPSDLAAAIENVLARLDDEGSAWRARIVETSTTLFSWPATASSYRGLVRRLLADPSGQRTGTSA